MTRLVRVLALMAVVYALGAPTVRAAEDGEWILDANNWQEGKELLPDPVLKRLQNGEYWFKVVAVEPERFKKNFAQKFWDGTKANAGKYDVEPKQCGLVDKATGKIPEFLTGFQSQGNPYGEGRSTERIVQRLRQIELDDSLTLKRFYEGQAELS